MRSPIGTRWYFGWNIVAAAAVLTLLSTGIRLGFGPYFLPMARDLALSRTQLSTIMAGGMLCYGLAMPLAGYLVSRWGTRQVLLAGAGMVLVSALWSVLATGATSFVLAFGVFFSVGLAFMSPVALTPIISHWFTRQRAMALFFLAAGSMAGIAVMTPLMALLIELAGWRATLLGCSVLLAACTAATALYVVRDVTSMNTDLLPQEAAAQRAHAATLPQPLEPLQAMRTGPFWRIAWGMACCGFGMSLLGLHGVPMLLDRGFGEFHSAMTVGLVGLAAIGGTVLLGSIADRLPARSLLATVYFVRGFGFLALLLAASSAELYVAALLMGVVWAGSAALSASLLSDVYGVRLVGVLYGLAFVGHQLGAAAGSFVGGWGYEAFQTHWVSFGVAGMLLVSAAIVALQLPDRGATAMPPQPAPAR